MSTSVYDAVSVCVVVEGPSADAPEIPGVSIYRDPDGAVAKRLGVYSTPHAVILSKTGELYYRGNYNRGRFCADPKTEFARLALESLLANGPPPQFPKSATLSYGCARPGN